MTERVKLTPDDFKDDLRCGRQPYGTRKYHLCNVCHRLTLLAKDPCPLNLNAGRATLKAQEPK